VCAVPVACTSTVNMAIADGRSGITTLSLHLRNSEGIKAPNPGPVGTRTGQERKQDLFLLKSSGRNRTSFPNNRQICAYQNRFTH
jgi:hypothetical protein